MVASRGVLAQSVHSQRPGRSTVNPTARILPSRLKLPARSAKGSSDEILTTRRLTPRNRHRAFAALPPVTNQVETIGRSAQEWPQPYRTVAGAWHVTCESRVLSGFHVAERAPAEVTAGLAEGARVILHPGDTLAGVARVRERLPVN